LFLELIFEVILGHVNIVAVNESGEGIGGFFIFIVRGLGCGSCNHLEDAGMNLLCSIFLAFILAQLALVFISTELV
jgi:hypothetical protein